MKSLFICDQNRFLHLIWRHKIILNIRVGVWHKFNLAKNQFKLECIMNNPSLLLNISSELLFASATSILRLKYLWGTSGITSSSYTLGFVSNLGVFMLGCFVGELTILNLNSSSFQLSFFLCFVVFGGTLSCGL